MVAFTPNISLAKPTNSEVAKNWIELSQYQSGNNTTITNKTNIALTNYSPVFTGHVTPPSIGAGAIRAEYMDQQGFVTGNFVIEFLDPGVSVGSDVYGLSLPFPVDGTFHSVGTALNQNVGSFSCIGEGYVFDASNINGSGGLAFDAVTISGVSYLRFITQTYSTKTSRLFRDTQPISVSTADRISGQFFYKKA